MITGREGLLVFLVSLCPVLVISCSCPVWPVNRMETLKQALDYSRQVYSAVVLGATCSCFSGNGTMDCRRYSEESDIYTVDVINRVVEIDTRNSDPNYYFKTCTEAESNCLAVGENIRRGPEPENDASAGDYPNPRPVCQFGDDPYNNDVCRYSVRVTEVFVGSYTVGEIVSSSGPDVGYCGQLGRILQLNEQYVAGVGSFCSNAFNSWSPLSEFTKEDLEFLRGTGNNETSINESATVYSSAATIILLTVTGIALM